MTKKSGEPRISMTVKDIHVVDRWVEKNKQHLKTVKRAKAIELCFADTGLRCGDDTMRQILEVYQCSCEPKERGQFGQSRNTSQVIASELRRLMEQLGIAPSQNLVRICEKKAPVFND